MTTQIAGSMIADGAIDDDKLDPEALSAILEKLGIPGLLAALDTRLDALEGGPAPEAPASFDVGDYCWSARATKAKWLLCNGGAVSRTTYSSLFAILGTRYGAGDGSTTFNLPASAGRSLVAAGTGTVVEALAGTAFNVASDVITVPTNAEKWVTGRKVRISTTTTMPGGLAINTDYFVIRLSATQIQLANSLANALNGVAVNFTTTGAGTHTITHTFTARALGDLGGEETHALTVTEMPAHAHTNGGTLYGGGVGSGGAEGMTGFAMASDTGSVGGNSAHNNMQPFQVENLFIYAGV